MVFTNKLRRRWWLCGMLASQLFAVRVLSQPVTEVDVCVYGATSSGITAAYTAKRLGKRVLLVEPSRHLGGLSSGGLGYTDIGNKYVVTGLARNFYRRVGQHYGKFEQWIFEPHVARQIFEAYLREARVPILFSLRIVGTQKHSTRVEAITLEDALRPSAPKRIVKAKVFIDCTYEGDLMAQAGVSYIVGREANLQYGETFNGVQLQEHHQFPDGVDPYRVPGDPQSGLLWGVKSEALSPSGSGDKKVQAYNFRICLTDDPVNRIQVTRPEGYDSTRFELLARLFATQPDKPLNYHFLKWDLLPNRKTDINNYGPFSTDLIGMNHDYPEADYATRARIAAEHKLYNQSLLYFLGHDARVPAHIRRYVVEWGFPKDEYREHGHWSPQLYIREARRMIGEYIMTEHNCLGREVVPDVVGMAAYTMDSHNCQRLVIEKNGKKMVKNEGDVQIGGFPPYPIAYRSLTPKRSECTNLLVPVCLSASHIAYGSIRMEPVFMVLGQAAAVAAVLAIEQQNSVQAVDVAQLQKILRQNPLADGTPADLLIDNDINPDQVRPVAGDWTKQRGTIAQMGGTYAATTLVSEGTTAAAIEFRTQVSHKGNYRLYLYYPASIKAPDAQYVLTHAGGRQSGKVKRTDRQDDWIGLGTFVLSPGTTTLEIRTDAGCGPLLADAALFVPVQMRAAER